MFLIQTVNVCVPGLSFKKGLAKLNASTDVDMLHCLSLPPCNVNVAIRQLKKDRYIFSHIAWLSWFGSCCCK